MKTQWFDSKRKAKAFAKESGGEIREHSSMVLPKSFFSELQSMEHPCAKKIVEHSKSWNSLECAWDDAIDGKLGGDVYRFADRLDNENRVKARYFSVVFPQPKIVVGNEGFANSDAGERSNPDGAWGTSEGNNGWMCD